MWLLKSRLARHTGADAHDTKSRVNLRKLTWPIFSRQGLCAVQDFSEMVRIRGGLDKTLPGGAPRRGANRVGGGAASVGRPVEQIDGGCLARRVHRRREIDRYGRDFDHRAWAMRCTVLVLTPCLAAITRKPGRSFRRSAARIEASTSASILGRPIGLPERVPSALARLSPARTRS